MTQGHIFERVVEQALAKRGWIVEPFGQAMISDRMRIYLQRTQSPVRWLPDLIAAKSYAHQTNISFVDAKAGLRYQETGRHDIERASAEAAEGFAQFTQCPVWFAFHDGSVTTPDRVLEVGRPGTFRGNGSGTKFILISQQICENFDYIFGTPERLEETS